MKKEVGKTKDAGFQFGLRKTFPLGMEKVWDTMFSEEGLQLWLGKDIGEWKPGKSFCINGAISGEIKIFKHYSHVRMRWKKAEWDNISTLQLRIYGDHQKATLSFHQENLRDSQQREEMKQHWNAVMKDLQNFLGG